MRNRAKCIDRPCELCYPIRMDDCSPETDASRAARLIREEIERLAPLSRNFKIILNCTAGGMLKTMVTETYQDVSRVDRPVCRPN